MYGIDVFPFQQFAEVLVGRGAGPGPVARVLGVGQIDVRHGAVLHSRSLPHGVGDGQAARAAPDQSHHYAVVGANSLARSHCRSRGSAHEFPSLHRHLHQNRPFPVAPDDNAIRRPRATGFRRQIARFAVARLSQGHQDSRNTVPWPPNRQVCRRGAATAEKTQPGSQECRARRNANAEFQTPTLPLTSALQLSYPSFEPLTKSHEQEVV